MIALIQVKLEIMNNNRYYILPIGLLNLVGNSEIVEQYNVNVDGETQKETITTTVRKNLQGNKFICKTKQGVDVPPYFSGKPSLNQDEAIIEMAKAEWTENI